MNQNTCQNCKHFKLFGNLNSPSGSCSVLDTKEIIYPEYQVEIDEVVDDNNFFIEFYHIADPTQLWCGQHITKKEK